MLEALYGKMPEEQ